MKKIIHDKTVPKIRRRNEIPLGCGPEVGDTVAPIWHVTYLSASEVMLAAYGIFNIY